MDLIDETRVSTHKEPSSERLRRALECLHACRFEVVISEHIHWPPGRTIQPHHHDDLFHMDFFHGSGRVSIDNRSLPLRRTLMMIPPGWTHAFASTPKSIMRNRMVKFLVHGEAFPRNLPFIYLFRPDETLLRHVEDGLTWIFEEWQMRQEGWEDVCGGILKSLMTVLLRAEMKLQNPRPHGVLEEACYVMAMQYSRSLPIHDVAAQCGVRADALSRLFRTHLHVSPREYLQSIRLKQAQSLLAGGYTVTEVAEQTGFASVHYFSRVFTRVFGIAPSRWRPGHKPAK